MTSTTLPPVAPAARPAWLAGGLYVLMLVGAVGAFLLIRHLGEGLIAPEARPRPSRSLLRRPGRWTSSRTC